ncbi:MULTISPECIES: amino acid adenylation domain-containing protein [Streptomyces]|uniref:Acyl-CoA synthetase n=2 Tax=Streptomyces TaxID=1883 RepID=A0A2U9NUS8_STRAS|nr:amino acid adenylation domain-containing protein [Streptomyces actuosus]AWT41030.1 acyl-CoA synthetase [Streptomyces actuosus]MBM4826473.1 amino acid adenylation domain-containing protein [Streptomyces actuosus]
MQCETLENTPDLVQAFTEAALRDPERAALVHEGRVVTYGRLSELVHTLAERLGPRPGAVAVPATHSPDTVVAMLGVLAAGGAYCPVDPAFPPARRQEMVSAAGCRTAVATDAVPELELGLPTTHLSWEEGGGGAADSGFRPDRNQDPEAAAYILFTSGSTGRPKPVVTPRRAISASVRSLRGLFALTEEDRVLQFASLNWDTSLEEILPALTAGATLVFDREAHSGSFPRFLRMVERERVSVLDLPTAFWHELVLHLTEEATSLPDCVRLMVIGGEAVSPARLADWSRLDTGRIRLVNTYGCTETTLITHAVDLHGPSVPVPAWDWSEDTRAPIGRALPHVVEHIGEDDELLIGGPAVALGYLGMPQATEKAYVVVDGERRFRTGDRVGRTPDGLLTHEGRLNDEIKIRGVRVDPAEVEAHLASHPAVNTVAVTGATAAGRTTLVAYVVPRQHAGTRGLDADLRTYLRERVPAHLVPSRITVVPQLVLTTSGKVDRKASHQRYATVNRSKETVDER